MGVERGLGSHPVGSGAAAGQLSLLTKASPPTYIVSFCPSHGDRPASLLTSEKNVSCLLQVFFQATSPGYVTLIKSRCNRMFDRRGQMAFEKKSTSVRMTQHSFPVWAQPSKALHCWPWVGAYRETHKCFQDSGRGSSLELLILNCLLCKHPWHLLACYSSVGIGSCL